MRPNSILWFERLFLISLVIGIINTALSYEDNLAMLQADPGAEKLGFGGGFVLITAAFSFGLMLLLWYFIARRASPVAKWILVALTVLGILSMPSSLAMIAKQNIYGVIIPILLTLLQIAALVFFFRQDAKAWFASRGRMDHDPEIFR